MYAQRFIVNRLMSLDSGLRTKVFNPSDGQSFAEIAYDNVIDTNVAVHAARWVFEGVWSQLAPAKCSRVLMRVALRLADYEEELARLEARDIGKPMRQARADARAVARYFELYAGAVDKLHGQTIPYPADIIILAVREPHDVTVYTIP